MSKNNRETSAYSISQNFLTSRRTIERLLAHTDINERDTVLEIGAGKGHITRALLERAGAVRAVEADPALFRGLEEQLGEAPGLTLLPGDFLKLPLPQGPYKVFSNIPFSITTKIIDRLTQAANPPTEAWLILEKGAAKRFCGLPAESGASLLLKPFFEASMVCALRREDFHPMPSVDAALLRLTRRKRPDLPLSDRRSYERFLCHSRKYGLFGAKALLTKKQISTALRLEKLPQIERSGNVLYVQWLCLFRCYQRFGLRTR